MIYGHLHQYGNCYEAACPTQAAADKVDNWAEEHGHNVTHGKCHGREINQFQMHGCTLSTHVMGEPALDNITELGTIYGHVWAKGHCWQAATDSPAVAAKVNAMASAHGYDLKHGKCPGPQIRHHKMDGWTLSEHGKADQIIDNATELGAIYGHVWAKGHCWQAKTDSPAVAERVNKMASAHGYDLKHGPCKDKNVLKTWDFKHWTGTEHGKGEPMLDNISELIDQGLDLAEYRVTCVKGKTGCMSLIGGNKAQTDNFYHLVKAQYKEKGYECDMNAQSCHDRGFKHSIFHNKYGGVTVSTYVNGW